MAADSACVLKEGDTCWRLARAGRAAILIDGENYFNAVHAAILYARKSIYLIGWDIDSRVDLLSDGGRKPGGGEGGNGAPSRLRDLLEYVVERRADLTVHVLLWDYSMLYALEREPLPTLNLAWKTPARVRVCLDNYLPLGASHHQKLVVIDDSLAFCGGLDLTIRRWDTRDHKPQEPRRTDPNGASYGPFHDIQMMVDGEAAAALAEVARQRWSDAECEKPAPLTPGGDPWPAFVKPDFENVTVGVARTLPELHERGEIREVERLYVKSIESAERFIYIENQYLSSIRVVDTLIKRMKENENLELVIISRGESGGWFEEQSMGIGRVDFKEKLIGSVDPSRLRLLCAAVVHDGRDIPVNVHAKLMIVDDRFLRVGSSNLNNRSMGLDTECDLAIEAENDEQKRAICRVRNDLLAEHLGVDCETVAEAFGRGQSLLAVVDGLCGKSRKLNPIEDNIEIDGEWAKSLRSVADPDRPLAPEEFVGDMYGAQEKEQRQNQILALTLIGLMVLGMVLIWQFTPLAQLTNYEYAEPYLQTIKDSPFTIVAIPLIYAVASVMFFPVTALIALTALTFGAGWGFFYAFLGSLLGAAVTFLIGDLAGRVTLRDLMGKRINRISRKLSEKGILAIVTSRIVPMAPFSLINLVAGATHIRFRDFLIGTAIGMAPGIAVMTALGDSLRQVWQNPSPLNLALVVLAVLAWLGLSVGLQLLVTRWRARRRRAQSNDA
ncbi:MAG: VTT domain-containing protein [Rhodospirillales bacterium]